MKIALIGYGRMGRTIEALGKQRGHEFPLIIDLDNKDDLNEEYSANIDVAIEFSSPASAPDNILNCLNLGLPVVSGTTGWYKRIKEIESRCKELKGSLFTASNFSIGVNILFSINRKLAAIMNHFPEYVASMEEVHHIHKLDAPSGTALTLAEGLIGEINALESWNLDECPDPSCLNIRAIREGEVKGKHSILYESALDSIRIEHDAKSRDGFAAGAILAAEFIHGKCGIFGMKDMLKLD